MTNITQEQRVALKQIHDLLRVAESIADRSGLLALRDDTNRIASGIAFDMRLAREQASKG